MQMKLSDPDRIGPYHILQVIGEGGMGIVYEAEQREPVRRRVAIKMLKLGMDTTEVLGRFETERQSLAVMDHPGIARVLDAGMTDTGRPYFAMELVPGVTIDEYCKLQRLTTEQRLELMIGVCQAVQHAHQKGVIHRDLKPGNILVKEEGGRSQPKIIDFGIAKATGQRLSQRTVVTMLGTAMGTLAYMSPEQAEMSGLDVDTRTDVYSLGVILHELLTDQVPMDPTSTNPQVFILKLMQRDEALPMLTQSVAGLDATRLQAVASLRRTDVKTFRHELAGDLRWIVSKAIEKDRARRYDTANALALDLRRYLDAEPVLAHAPSTTYRLRKFARRNRRGVIAAAIGLVALVVGTVGTTVGLFRAREAEAHAAREASASKEVAGFLASLFALSDPSQARGRVMTARELLDTGATRVTAGLRDQPDIRARLARTIGEVYTGLGHYREAASLLELALADQRRLLGPDDPQTLQTAYSLGEVYFYRGDYAASESLYAHVAKGRAQVLGPHDSLTIKADGALAAAWLLLERWNDAETGLLRAHASAVRTMGPENPETLSILNNLQALYMRRARYDEAEKAAAQVLSSRRRVLGADHPAYLTALHNIASVHAKQGRWSEAEREFREALDGRRRVEGAIHPRTLGTMASMAGMYEAQRRFVDAEPLYVSAVEGYESTVGVKHPQAQRSIAGLADMYSGMGRTGAAAALRAKLDAVKRTK